MHQGSHPYLIFWLLDNNVLGHIIILIVRCIIMSLMVRVRLCGDSFAITLPRQVARMHNIERGDTVEISPIGSEEFKIKKVFLLISSV